LHIASPSPLIPLLTSSSLSSSLVHLITHPPKLISHLATSYLTLPPPASPPAKFWGIFIPISERDGESDRLVFGPGGDGGVLDIEELVVEVVLRGGEDSLGRRKRVERTLEGWSGHDPCMLTELESLRHIWNRKPVDEVCFFGAFLSNIHFLFPPRDHARSYRGPVF
jgi:elongator complex protein 5